MRNARATVLLWAVLATALILVALYLPLPLATHADFRVLYYTDVALTQGIDVYDHAAKTQMVAQMEGIAPGDVTAFPQFPYPPWLATSTFFLGLVPIESSAMLWFELNLVMLLVAVGLLTTRWPFRKRLWAASATFLFAPVLGILVVGQYALPALLGAALALYAVENRRPALTALGIVLLTFKPHLGALIILACVLHLVWRRDSYGWAALRWTAGAAGLVFLSGFLGDPRWPASYLTSLRGYTDLGHITSCADCASVPVWIARGLTGAPNLSLALRLGVVLFMLLGALLSRIRPPLWGTPSLLINSSVLVTLAASPYLYNYDYVMLLIPMLTLAGQALRIQEKVALAVAALLPTSALALFGREGNPSFVVALAAVAVLTAVLARRADGAWVAEA